MASNHHDFVFVLRVDAGDVAEDVDAFFAIAGEFGVDVQLEFHRHIPIEKPFEPPVMFDRHDDERHGHRVSLLIHEPAERVVRVGVNRAAAGAALGVVCARHNYRANAFRSEKPSGLLHQLGLGERLLVVHRVRCGFTLGERGELPVVKPLEQGRLDRDGVRRRGGMPEQDDLSSQFASVRVEFTCIGEPAKRDDVRSNRARGCRRPRRRLSDERRRRRGDHPQRNVPLLPAHAKLAPALGAYVREAHLFQSIQRPRGRLLQIGRTGQPGPDSVNQLRRIVHHSRLGIAFDADASVHDEVGSIP